MYDLVKEAISPRALKAMERISKGVGSGGGVGALLGGGLGGAASGASQYNKLRDEGRSVGESIGGSLGAAGKGALHGGVLGAGLGGIAGGLKPQLTKGLSQRGGLVGAASRFGERQTHSLTGLGDTNYVRSIGGGAAQMEKELKGLSPKASPRAVASAQKNYDAAVKAEQMGLTSLPGYAKALYRNPGEAIKAGLNEQWRTGGLVGKGMMAAAPLGVASELTNQDQPIGTRFERAGQALGTGLGYSAGPLPVAASSVLAPVLSGAFGTLGKGVDKVINRKGKVRNPAPPALDPAGGDTQATEHVLTDRASGAVPEL